MHHVHYHADDLSFLTIRKEFTGYSWEVFRLDFFAAVSVALLTVPQAMAYSLLAGLPLTTGLFAAIYSSVIASLFGSSRHLIVGPSNGIAIMLQAGTAEILFTYYRGLSGPERDMAAMEILTQLCLLVSIFQMLAAGCKLGRLAQFVSHSVIVAFMTGTAIALVINQLFTFTGIPNTPGGDSLYAKGSYLATHFQEIHWPTAMVGLGSFLLVLILRKWNKKIPGPLIALILSAVAVHALSSYPFGSISTEETQLQYWGKVLVLGDTGSLSTTWPAFAFPHFDMGLLNYLLPFAFAVTLLNILETISIAKTLAANSGQRLSVNQEIFGISMGNLLSSFITAMPVSGNASRSCVSYALGARTRMTVVLNAMLVAAIFLVFGFMIMHVPLAALSALLLASAGNIINPRQFFLCLKATSSDAFVLWITLVSCIFLSLDVALYIGIVLSIILYLKKSAIPQLVEYDINESGELHNLDYSKSNEHKSIRVIKVEGELFFGAADLFQTTLKTIAEDDTSTKVIVLQLRNARDIDATVCLALQQLHNYLKGSGRYLIACGMTQQIWNVLSDSGLIEEIGKENLFIFDERNPHKHMVKALKRARFLTTLSEALEEESKQKEQESVLPGLYELGKERV